MAALKLHKIIKANKTMVLIASLVSCAALLTLLIHTFTNNLTAIGIFLIFICISVLFELVYGKIVRKHIFQRPYKNALLG